MDLPGVLPHLSHGPSPVWMWSGELDAADVAALRGTWQTLLQDRPPSVAINLAGVTFLDCGVLSVLIRANCVPDTLLELLTVPPVVHRLTQLTDLSTFFTAATSPDPHELPDTPDLLDLPGLSDLPGRNDSGQHPNGLEQRAEGAESTEGAEGAEGKADGGHED